MILNFVGCDDAQVLHGGQDDPRPVLTVGEDYTVSALTVHDWVTGVSLYGIEGSFNSVCFMLVDAPEFAKGKNDG